MTEHDVNIAEKIFGPDVETLKGKTTRRKPGAVKEDQVEVPPELIAEPDDLIYCMDLFYVCLLYTSPSPRDGATSRMPSSA